MIVKYSFSLKRVVLSLKETLETKTSEFKTLIQQNLKEGKKTQKALIAIALAVFLLLCIAYF